MKVYRFFTRHMVLLFVLFGVSIGLWVIFSANSTLSRTQLIAYELAYTLVWLVLITAVVVVYPLRKSKQIFNACAPEIGVEFTDFLLQGVDVYKRIQKSTSSEMMRAILLDRAMYLTLLGRFDEALAVYAMLEQYCGTLPKKYMAVMYHNLIILACAQGNAAVAQYYFEQETALLRHGYVRLSFSVAALGRPIQDVLLSDEIRLSICRGDLVRAEALFRQYQATEKPPKNEWMMNLVCGTYEIGTLYYRMGNYAEAVPRLQFVAENGGTTFFCARAKEMLARIEHTNFN